MKYSVSGEKVVLDIRSWIAGGGEAGVEIRSEGLSLILEVFLEVKVKGRGRNRKREIRFSDVCSFSFDRFPGPEVPAGTSFEGVDISRMLGSLIEFENSDLADAWTRHYDNRRKVRHFLIDFLSEQISVVIFATDFVLSEEIVE